MNPPNPTPIPTIRSRIRALCDEPEHRYREMLADDQGGPTQMTTTQLEPGTMCQWFAKCENEATTTRRGPIGSGAFGEVPICERCDVKVEAIDKGCSEERIVWCREAYKLGTIKAEDAATWIVDGNTSQETIQRILHMMDEGDPAVEHFLPRRPNMSGEFADAPTTNSVIVEATGKPEEQIADEDREAILNAWEDGVNERFEAACEEELRKAAS